MWIYILYFYLGFLSNDIDDAPGWQGKGKTILNFFLPLPELTSAHSERTQNGNLWFPRYVLSIHMEEIAIVVFNR